MHTLPATLFKSYLKNYSGLPPAAWRGITLSLFESTLMGLFYFLSIYFIQDLNFNIAIAGTILSFYGLGAMAGGILSGKLSDLTQPYRISIISLVLQAFGYFVLIFLKSFYLLAFIMFLLGIASYSFITSNQVFVLKNCDTHEPLKLRAINLLSTSSNLGLAISAIIISAVAGLGFHILFFVTSLLLFLIATFLIKNKKQFSLNETPTVIEHQHSNELMVKKPKKRITLLVLCCVLLIGMIVSQLGVSYTIYIQETFPTLGLKAVSILFALNSILVVLLETPIGNYFSNYNKLLMVGIGSFLIGLGMYMLTLSSFFIIAILACCVYTLGEIIFFCMAQFVCYQNADENQKGFSLGLFRLVYASSRIAGPVTGGFVYYHFGANMLWLLSGMIGSLCLFSCVYFKDLLGPAQSSLCRT